jgi:mannose-1-phosphate guanylyltransferase
VYDEEKGAMKAVILVGGQGTRLRPLTESKPKPMIPVANRPHMEHVFNLLKQHGIDTVILALGYLPGLIQQYFGNGERFGLRIIYSVEDEPLGTAGPVKLVESQLDDTFLVFNGDIMTDLNLSALIDFHRQRHARMTLALTPVEDPSSFGLVMIDPDGRIREFREKPSRTALERWDPATPALINAGTYVMEPDLLKYIPANQSYMFEQELFPLLLKECVPLYGYVSDAYWADLGTPERYLSVNHDVLLGEVNLVIPGQELWPNVWVEGDARIAPSAHLRSGIVIGSGVEIAERAHIIGPAAIGPGCHIGPESHVEDVILWENVTLMGRNRLSHCIVASNTLLAEDVELAGGAVVGDHCTIESGNRLHHGIRLWPHRTLQPRTITF